jgi:hypothetical protein
VTQPPEELWETRARELLDKIPGYRGYRLKEERRDADRRVRAAVADGYAVELARVERIGRELANARQLGEIGAIERASQSIRHFIDRVRTQSPGYGGLFGDRDVDGVALDQLRLFDEGLLLGVDELRPVVDKLEAAGSARQPLSPAAEAIAKTMDSQILRLDTRRNVIESGHAASQADVLAALRPLSEVAPPDVYSAKPGDAISILGDDHLVDAAIEVDGRPLSFRVLRIARDPEEWLMVGRDPNAPMLRLKPAEPSDGGLSIAGRSMRQTAAGTGDGEIVAERGPSGPQAVRYALLEDADDPQVLGLVLDWDGSRQAFVGGRAEPLDVEVFRRSESAGS